MSTSRRPDVTVVGAGAVGLTTALRLLTAGYSVALLDPGPVGGNASGVAAGMLAPHSEALSVGAAAFSCLRSARDLWPTLATRLGVSLDRSGAVHLVAPELSAGRLASLLALGGHAERVARPPWIDRQGRWDCVWTPEDWRLNPPEVLTALQRAFLASGGELRRERWTAASPARGLVILAGGWSARSMAARAPQARHLSPIKGQILRFAGGPVAGPVVRLDDLYLVPDRDGLIVGATMEVGAADDRLDPVLGAQLRAAAASITSTVARLDVRQQTGVRAATADGWPLVGPSSRADVWLATGARRNGWLLAPLIAEVIVAQLDGRDVGDAGRLFDAQRFG